MSYTPGITYTNDIDSIRYQMAAQQQQQSQAMAQQRYAELLQRQAQAAQSSQGIGYGFNQGVNLYTNGSNKLVVDGDLEVKGKIITVKKESKMLGIYGSLKNYIAKHADLIFTVLLVMLADKWFFKGAFTNTLQSLVGKLVNRAHDEVDSKPLTVAK